MRWIYLLVLATVFVACDTNDGFDGEPTFLYVANQNSASVTVFNVEEERIETTVDLTKLGFSANAKPHHVAAEPDGSAWYVSLIGDGKIVKLSRANAVLGSVETETPGMLALDPTSDVLVAGRSMTAPNPPASVVIVDRKTMTIEEERPVVFPRPHALGLAHGMVFTASLGQNRIAALPLDGSPTVFSQVTGSPTSLAHLGLSPDGMKLILTGEPDGTVFFMQREMSGALVQQGALTLGNRPWHPHYSPDGASVYVPLKGANAIAVLDAATRTERRRITGEGLAEPHGVMFSPDGGTLYVSNNNLAGTYATSAPGVGTLVLIDVRSAKVRKVFEVGANPAGMGISGAHHAH